MPKSGNPPSKLAAWLIVPFVLSGFVIGGIGVIVGWPVFWAGVAVVAAGLLYGKIINVMDYTEEYDLNDPNRVEPGTTTFHG